MHFKNAGDDRSRIASWFEEHLRAIATVNVPPIQRKQLEDWLCNTKKIRIRGGEPSKLRLSTPYYLRKQDIEGFLAAFDEYKREKV